jgi:hypothetical protein
MARGWESKNIESQQEEAARARQQPKAMTPEEQARQSRRRSLELARSRAQADLDRATVPAHRDMLRQAIAALEEQLSSL